MDADIVVVSDLHLGFRIKRDGCGFLRKKFVGGTDFQSFIDGFLKKKRIHHLILLGDILEFWRECPFEYGLSWPFPLRKWIDVLVNLSKVSKANIEEIHYVAGNHDYRAGEILPETNKTKDLRFIFPEGPIHSLPGATGPLYLKSGNLRFTFLHGFQLLDNLEFSMNAIFNCPNYVVYAWFQHFPPLCLLGNELSDIYAGLKEPESNPKDEVEELYRKVQRKMEPKELRKIRSRYRREQAKQRFGYRFNEEMYTKVIQSYQEDPQMFRRITESSLAPPNKRKLLTQLKTPKNLRMLSNARWSLWDTARRLNLIKPKDWLVLGHTHEAYVLSRHPLKPDEGGVANSGCWTDEGQPPDQLNTFLVIKNGIVNSFRWDKHRRRAIPLKPEFMVPLSLRP